MRIAYCLHGIIGGSKGKDGRGSSSTVLNLGYKHYYDHIFTKNDNVDTFIHTWSVDDEDEIRSLYNPVSMVAEPQIQFVPTNLVRVNKAEPNRSFNIYSKWYSLRESLNIRRQYESEHDFKYDCVMVTRFDTVWRRSIRFNEHDMNYFYVPHLCMYWSSKKKRLNPIEYWENHDSIDLSKCQHGHVGWPHRVGKWGFWDCWFFGGPAQIDVLRGVFANLEEYTKQNPQLQKRLSSHTLTEMHLKKNNMLDKVKFHLHFWTDTPVVRAWYAKELR